MTEPDVIIEDKTETTEIEAKPTAQTAQGPDDDIEDLAASVKEFAAKIPESISRALGQALSGRDFPLMVRVGAESLKCIDQLVDAGVFKSRSESAAFLISEGVKAQAALFERIEAKIHEIDKLREELKNIIHQEIAESSS